MPHNITNGDSSSELEPDSGAPKDESVRYAAAKIALIGDGGVGKSELGHRVAGVAFRGQVVLSGFGTTLADGTRCEAVLWDFPGEPDHRLIHTLFLDDVDLAIIVFDPTARKEPLKSVEYWLKQLPRREGQPCQTIIVAARVDTGSLLTAEELNDFCDRNGVSGRHVSTSIKTGEGLAELSARIRERIPWGEVKAISAVTFFRVRQYISALKKDVARKEVLISPTELHAQLTSSHSGWELGYGELMAALGLIATHGEVALLRGLREHSSAEMILLAPDLLASLASAFVTEARRTPLGTLDEGLLLRGEYVFSEISHLKGQDQKILLDAATVLFIEHNVCFRQPFATQTLLVFPALITQRRPANPDVAVWEDVSYVVTGEVENVYAALVVLLGYTNTFTHKNQWQNQAQYEMGPGEICGFRQTEEREGEAEFVLYYKKEVAEHTRLIFQGHFEKFLKERNVGVLRVPPVFCPECGYQQARTEVIKRWRANRRGMFCSDCDNQIEFAQLKGDVQLSRRDREELEREQALARRRTDFETALVTVKSLILARPGRDSRPSCFISYARGVSGHERWVEQLVNDLSKAEVAVVYDRWHNPAGGSISKFIERLMSCDSIVVVGTPKLREKYDTESADPVVDAELRLINSKLMKRAEVRETVLPLLLDGSKAESFPPLFEDSVHIDFRRVEDYFTNLLAVILRVYKIPFDDPAVVQLQGAMR